jgi:cyanophycinase
MGGGADQDAAFRWMCDRAGSGAFVILRASGTDAYNSYLRSLCPRVSSAETLIITSREQARDASVASNIRRAGALFIAGGSQDNYVNWWRGTPVESAINDLIVRGAPVGGTSAGLAVMGEYMFSALVDTVQSTDALRNPFDRRVTIDRNFLRVPHLEGKITDSHFVARNRMGRLIVFLARIAQAGWTPAPYGIGIDERTAVLMEEDGRASVVGQGAAYFVHAWKPPDVCRPDIPLTYQDISVYRLSAGAGQFDISAWKGDGGTAYTVSARNGVLTSTLAGGGFY